MSCRQTSKPKQHKDHGRVRAGVGGWIYAPWRGTFYPKGLRQADELAYAASAGTAVTRY
jgi:uncharacterized protein YecE (DUF72 family)